MIRPRNATSRGSRVVAVAMLLLGVAGGCSSTGDPSADGPTPLDDEQAERLAGVRFENFQAGAAVFSTEVPVDGQTVAVRGVVDWREHVGSAVVAPSGGGADLVQWSFSHIAYHAGGGGGHDLPPPPPADGAWRFLPFDPSVSSLDTVLALVLNLAHDRPENAQLLLQGDARHLETRTLDGVEVDVFAGPTDEGQEDGSRSVPTTGGSDATSRFRYWIDDDGQLRRLEVRLGGSTEFVAIDFDTTDVPDVEMMPDFPTPETSPGP